jgi:hypothetical protein
MFCSATMHVLILTLSISIASPKVIEHIEWTVCYHDNGRKDRVLLVMMNVSTMNSYYINYFMRRDIEVLHYVFSSNKHHVSSDQFPREQSDHYPVCNNWVFEKHIFMISTTILIWRIIHSDLVKEQYNSLCPWGPPSILYRQCVT